MIFLATAVRWFLGGGWKIVGIAAIALAAMLLIARISYWREQAGKVDGLEAQIAETDKRAGIILTKLQEAEQKRGAAEAALSAWQSYKSNIVVQLKESASNAQASKLPACLPTDSERQLRNEALRNLLGPSGSNGELPNASGPSH